MNTAEHLVYVIGGPQCGHREMRPLDDVFLEIEGHVVPIYMGPHGPRAIWAKREPKEA